MTTHQRKNMIIQLGPNLDFHPCRFADVIGRRPALSPVASDEWPLPVAQERRAAFTSSKGGNCFGSSLDQA